MKYDVIIPAAGLSTRFNADTKKQFYCIDNIPVILRTAECFACMEQTDKIIIAIRDSEREAFEKIFAKTCFTPIFVSGGEKRADSVLNGLKQSRAEYAMVHDGARPFVKSELINRLLAGYRSKSIVIPAVKPYETVRYDDGNIKLLDRNNVFLIQTPQFADRIQLTEAIERSHNSGTYFTDEAQYMQEAGYDIIIVDGDRNNIKITSIDDIITAEGITRRIK